MKYTYKCQVEGCPKKFNNVTDWNKHHRSWHSSITYTCKKCNRISTSPIQHRDHIYLHNETQFTCGCCYKSSPSISRLNLHHHVHRRQRLYNCFSPNWKRMYKWPQDLLHHLNSHLLTIHRCLHCEHSNPEKRLLVQHIRVHSDDLPFACRQCGSHFKHSMQCYNHEKSLNHFATV